MSALKGVSHPFSDSPIKFRAYTDRNIESIPQLAKVPKEILRLMKAVASVIPFRVNNYVIDALIDWDNVVDDPIFQMVFPQPGMLSDFDLKQVLSVIDEPQYDRKLLNKIVTDIRSRLSPHPSGQMTLNVPVLNGERSEGIQHKYRETVLFFPAQGQICHSYCAFCFRWAQFTGDKSLKFSDSNKDNLYQYLQNNQYISNVILTGGDPLVMKTSHLQYYLEDFMLPKFDSIRSIRIGSKALTYWPYRFLSDPDADDMLRLFESLINSGKQVTLMAHFNHANELENNLVARAIKRLQNTGVVIRSQGPILKHVNASAKAWIDLWNIQERFGIIPYYMFVERQTGSHRYYELPLSEAYKVYQASISNTSGLSRTARGPSMSATNGKVEVQGVTKINKENVFVLRYIQARDPDWVQKPFFAYYDENAKWFDQLKPFSDDDAIYFS